MDFKLTWFTDPRVEDSEALFHPQIALVVEPAGQHLLAEGEDVRRPVQLKVLVRPHLARGAAARLHLVDAVHDVVLFADGLEKNMSEINLMFFIPM